MMHGQKNIKFLMASAGCSETSEHLCQWTRRPVPERSKLNISHRLYF